MNIKEELIVDWEEEFKDIVKLQYLELSEHHDLRPFKLNSEAYLSLNSLGILRTFTVREDELLGYCSFILSNNMRYCDWKHAICEGYYIKPEFRKNKIGSIMLTEVERLLKEMGVNSIVIQDKFKHPHRKFFEGLGFEQTENTYEKII